MNRPEQELVHKPLVAQIRARALPDVVWWHSPNGAYFGKNRFKQAKVMKALGLRAGVSDLCFLARGKFFALELKPPKGGRPTENQLEFLSDVQRAGGYSCVAEGLEEAIRCLEFWGLIRPEAV